MYSLRHIWLVSLPRVSSESAIRHAMKRKTHVQKLTELVVVNQPLLVLSEVKLDKITFHIKRHLLM